MLDGTAISAVARIGIGLRAPHVAALSARRPALDFLEVHAENYLDFGPAFASLMHLRRDYALTLHGVGLSLGSADGLDRTHLARYRDLVDRTEPMLVSEHLAWSIVDGVYLNDLLPLPYTDESLAIVAHNVAQAQDALGRQILIENPSRYLEVSFSTIEEADFLSALVARTGCAILCDVNNVYVTAHNVGGDPIAYLDALPATAVREIHLARHARRDGPGGAVLIDDHGSPVCAAVWDLYARARDRFGPVASLIERDRNLPPLDDLLDETDLARGLNAVPA